MTEEQNNLVERCLKYCKLNGLHLNEIDQARCSELNNKIIEQQSFFK
jgi:hypothetical protein